MVELASAIFQDAKSIKVSFAMANSAKASGQWHLNCRARKGKWDGFNLTPIQSSQSTQNPSAFLAQLMTVFNASMDTAGRQLQWGNSKDTQDEGLTPNPCFLIIFATNMAMNWGTKNPNFEASPCCPLWSRRFGQSHNIGFFQTLPWQNMSPFSACIHHLWIPDPESPGIADFTRFASSLKLLMSVSAKRSCRSAMRAKEVRHLKIYGKRCFFLMVSPWCSKHR
jgi:hypothetical protein